MYYLSLKPEQSAVVAERDARSPLVKVTVLEINGAQVRLEVAASAQACVYTFEEWRHLSPGEN